MPKVSSFFVVENIAPGTWNTLLTQNFSLKNRFHKPFCQARHLGHSVLVPYTDFEVVIS